MPLYCSRTRHYLQSTLLPDHDHCRFFQTPPDFSIGDLCIRAFSVPHDATDPVEFSVSNGDGMFGVLTDLGHATRLVHESLRLANVLLIEANYDEKMLQEDTRRPWSVKSRIQSRHGASANKAAAETILEIGATALSAGRAGSPRQGLQSSRPRP